MKSDGGTHTHRQIEKQKGDRDRERESLMTVGKLNGLAEVKLIAEPNTAHGPQSSIIGLVNSRPKKAAVS